MSLQGGQTLAGADCSCSSCGVACGLWVLWYLISGSPMCSPYETSAEGTVQMAQIYRLPRQPVSSRTIHEGFPLMGFRSPVLQAGKYFLTFVWTVTTTDASLPCQGAALCLTLDFGGVSPAHQCPRLQEKCSSGTGSFLPFAVYCTVRSGPLQCARFRCQN